MSARDPVVLILAGLERPVAPRPEFADALLARLLEELRESRVPTGKAWRPRLRLPQILPSAPPRLRLVLIAIALLLLLTGVALATYFGIRTWISAGPRGVQYTSDFRLVELARGVEYGRITLAPNGDELYGISMPARHAQPDLRRAAIVQVSGLRGERVRSDVALRLLDLKQNPALWDPGADLSGLVVPEIFTVPEFSPKPSIAPNGDLAFVASVSPATTLSSFFKSGAKSTSLLVRHRDGKVEKVLTVRELVAAGLLNPAAAGQANMLFTVAFSAADRLFLYVNDEPGRNRFRSFYEVVDPNADGDWSDREVTPLKLPAFLGLGDRPVTEPESAWYVKLLAAELSLAGEDRSRSFLLMVSRFGAGENRVYRVSDLNGDGDALDEGELELLFAKRPRPHAEFESVLAPRIVVREGKIALRELLIGGFTTRTRVSRISDTGKVIDIARAFFRIEDVAADSEGDVYVLAAAPDSAVPTLYKLKPVAEGTKRETSRKPKSTSPPAQSPTTQGPPLTALRLAVTRTTGPLGGPYRRQIFFMRADGRRLGTLVSGGYPSLGPQSPSGEWIVYWSDREIPNEPFTYVAKVSTRSSKRLATKYLQAHCWRSDDTVLLDDYSERGSTLVLSDVRRGKQKTVLRDGGRQVLPPCSADGRFILLTSRARTTLELLDLRTGKRRRVRAPLTGRRYYGEAQLSPDGRRIAYTVDRLKAIRGGVAGVPGGVAYVQDLSTGRTRLVQRAKRQWMYMLWSPSSDHLLLRSTHRRRCRKGERGSEGCQAWSLFLVDVERATSKQLGLLLEGLWAAFLVQLVLTFPEGRPWSRAARIAIVGAYAVTFVGQLVGAFVVPDERDVLSVAPHASVAHTVDRAQEISGIAVALVVFFLLVQRLRILRGPARRAQGPLLVAAAIAVPASVVWLGWVITTAAGTSTLGTIDRAVAVSIPLGVVVGIMWSRLRRPEASELVVELRTEAAAGMRERLARALGDPTLEVAYRLGDGRYVDATGRPIELPHGADRAVTAVTAGGEEVAALVHDPALLDEPALVESVRATAGLVLENERLAAEVRSQLAEVRASRGRIVAAADAERRRIERNLHDGAQQRLVTLSVALSLEASRAGAAVSDVLSRAQDEVEQAIAELRELARGIHPTLLRDEGLEAAVEALARRTPLPVTVRGTTRDRLPDAVELAAYFIVSEALTNVVKHASASEALVLLEREPDALRVTVTDDGVGGASITADSGLAGLRDRLEALDATLVIESEPRQGTTVCAEIPCGS